jgi:hypothetical protein
MKSPALGQQFKTLLLWSAGLLLAIYLGWKTGSENYRLLILCAVIAIGFSIWFFTGRFFWVLTIASCFLGGTFPLLGGSFTPFQILMMIGVVKFVIEDVILKRRSGMSIGRFDLLMIGGFMGVLTLHALHHRFGMRFLGSSIWGGRNYVNVYVGLAAFFVIQSIPMNPKVWAKLPYAVLGVATFDLFISLITTIFPGSIYKIYPFYSAVSTLGIEELLVGQTTDITGRLGSFGNFGFILITIVLASTPLRQILNPERLLRFICLIGGLVAVLFSGFRSAVIETVIGFLAAGIRDLKYAAVALLPLFAVLLLSLSTVNSQFFHLPKQIQRGLAFLPGKWDVDMALNAEASNDFRRRLWSLWMKDYFPAHPWLGRGFGFRSEWAKQSVLHPMAIDYQQTVEVGNIHNGLFAAVDAFGIVGTIFFVVWNLRILARTFRVSFRRNDGVGMALRFLALYLAVWIISYWVGALNVGLFLPQEFALVAVFLRLQDMAASDFVQSEHAGKVQQDVHEELAPV